MPAKVGLFADGKRSGPLHRSRGLCRWAERFQPPVEAQDAARCRGPASMRKTRRSVAVTAVRAAAPYSYDAKPSEPSHRQVCPGAN